MESRLGDNLLAIYSDASVLKDGNGIRVGLVVYDYAQKYLHKSLTLVKTRLCIIENLKALPCPLNTRLGLLLLYKKSGST